MLILAPAPPGFQAFVLPALQEPAAPGLAVLQRRHLLTFAYYGIDVRRRPDVVSPGPAGP